MKKRLLSIFACLLVVLTLLPVPVSAAKSTLKITKQPKSCYVEAGEKISVTVKAKGKGLKYQWYVRNPGGKKFHKSSIKSATYECTMTEARNGRSLYCVVKDKYGNSVKTKTVVCKIPTALQITKQPESERVALGKKTSISVKAKGDGLTYQWYYRSAGRDTFSLSSITSATYSAKMTVPRSNREFYCVITDRYGNSVQTDTVTAMANGSFKASQYNIPVDKTKNLANQLGFSVDDTMTWTSSDPEIAEVSTEGVVTGLKKGTVTITALGERTGIRAKCKVRVGPLKQIALTFDDGPSSHTSRLLDYLEDNDQVKVTFFMVGDRLNSYNGTVKRIAKQGHELGYHSYSHQTQTNLSSSKITSDYNKSNKILKNLTGQSFTLWRTPGGAYNSRVLKSVPLPHILWSVDTRDWETRNATKVYNAIIKGAKDGAIILLHDLHGTTVDGAIKAMKKLQEEGYELVTVTELLSRNGSAPKAGKTYSSG